MSEPHINPPLHDIVNRKQSTPPKACIQCLVSKCSQHFVRTNFECIYGIQTPQQDVSFDEYKVITTNTRLICSAVISNTN